MTKTDFLEWKSDPRTKEVLKYIESECFTIAESLARRAGIDSHSDRFEAGVIRGMERILAVDYEDAND